ncbi:MAG: GNAT family N-acetyltransferase [Nitratireductor sp.]
MLAKNLKIVPSKKSDIQNICKITKTAFGSAQEAKLVESLLPSQEETISLIAKVGKEVAGHVLLTKVKAKNQNKLKAMALAPLSVLPKYREMQIGSQLVRQAIITASENKYDALFVLGDPLYYERFGFKQKAANGFKTPWPKTHFMALELKPNKLADKSDELIYPQAFEKLN